MLQKSAAEMFYRVNTADSTQTDMVKVMSVERGVQPNISGNRYMNIDNLPKGSTPSKYDIVVAQVKEKEQNREENVKTDL